VGDQLSLLLAPVTTRVYRPRGINVLQRLFKEHFQSVADQYEAKHSIIYGPFRIERITEVVEKFVLCGDYSQGVARIQCTNPDCKYEYFRPFSCKSFYFCPSCSQKRTLLFSQVHEPAALAGTAPPAVRLHLPEAPETIFSP
jgi:hypothetical protein